MLFIFYLCAVDDFASTLLYSEVPQFYTWESGTKTWKRRKRGKPSNIVGIFKAQTLGRMYTVSPKQGECFYLRLLLLSVKGPSSFEALRFYEGTAHHSYREACIARGLLEDDTMHRLTMQEASISHLPNSLRNLFALLLCQAFPNNPMALWEEFKPSLSEDYSFNPDIGENESFNMALISIEDMVMAMGGLALEDYGLPRPERDAAERTGQDYKREVSYNVEQQRMMAEQKIESLTADQRQIFIRFTGQLENQNGGLYFLDAPGGCGKTFLLETILASIRGRGQIAIATAGSGLAATLLPGGRTVHSTFKVPLNVATSDNAICSVKKGTSLCRLFKEATLLVIDEAPMLHRKVLECMDRTLRDLRSSELPMGGLPTLLCGDFRQILPVVPQGTRANIVNACLKKSPLWKNMTSYTLTTNLRVLQYNENEEGRLFADMLLQLGNGRIPITAHPDVIALSGFGTMVETVELLFDCVFSGVGERFTNIEWLMQRAILTPLNERVSAINNMLSLKLPGPTTTYNSINSVVDEEESVQFPVEFLNSIEVSGLPPHVLGLKVGMPIMILRSLNPPQLMNGTRCVVVECMRNIVEVEIAVGPYKGERHFIPRIPLQPSDTKFPFQFKRRQFPIRPCFAMTINKAQGQTLKCIGLDLNQSVFSHGMLYVALSRTGDRHSVFILSPSSQTRNVVYEEVL